MANKPILTIDVDDAKFKAFMQQFTAYTNAVNALPGAWNNVNQAAAAGVQTVVTQTNAIQNQNIYLNAQVAAAGQLQAKSKKTSTIFTSMASSTSQIAKNIAKATTSLLKWANLTEVVSGLAGAGGLYGIDRLALAAGSIRRSSQGLGISAAQQQAFGINYQRFFDPNSVLSNVANAKNDLSQRWAFGAMGIRDEDQKDAEQLSLEVARKAKQIVDQTNPAQLQQVATARGLLQFFSLDDLRRLRAATSTDLTTAESNTNRDTAQFNLPPDVLKNWTDFNTALAKSKTEIEDSLITGLGKLATPLGNLSTAVANALTGFLASPNLQPDLEAVANGIGDMATYLGSKQFGIDLQNFTQGVAGAGSALLSFVNWLNGTTSPSSPSSASSDGSDGTDGTGLAGIISRLPPGLGGTYNPGGINTPGLSGGVQAIVDQLRDEQAGAASVAQKNVYQKNPSKQIIDFFKSQGFTANQAAGIAANVQTESGFSPAAKHLDQFGAPDHWGLFQWDETRRAQIKAALGIDVATDTNPVDQEKAAMWELLNGEHRAMKATMGASSASDAAIAFDNTFERSGDNKYYQGQRGNRASVLISVYNATGGSAVVVTNQVAQQ